MTIAPVVISNTITYQMNRLNEVIDAINNGKLNFVTIATEASLPSPASAVSQVYIITNHTVIRQPVLAVIAGSAWYFTILRQNTINGTTVWKLESAEIGTGVVANKVVYVDSSGVFQLADPTDSTKKGIAIYTANGALVFNGLYNNSSLSLTVGADYYYDSTGSLTTTIGNGLIGKAINSTTLLIASIGSGGGSSAESTLLSYWMS